MGAVDDLEPGTAARCGGLVGQGVNNSGHVGSFRLQRVAALPSELLGVVGGLEGGGQPSEGQRGQQQAEIPEGDVVVVAEQQQVGDDAGQPGGDQVAADLGPDGHDQPGDNLDHADGQHRAGGAAGDQAVDGGCQVGGPVGQQVGELVQAEQDRGHHEPGPQDQERLVGGVVADGSVAGTGGGGGHGLPPLSRTYLCYRRGSG